MVTQQVQQGWGQMTPAQQQIIRQGIGGVIRRAVGKRRRKKSAKPASSRKRKRKAPRVGKILRKGSAAAKAWGRKMAKLRKR